MADSLPAPVVADKDAHASDDVLGLIRNRIFSEIAVGDSATITRTLTLADIQLFAVISGDANPQHLDLAFAKETRFHGLIAHGMFGGALISAVLGTRLPGPGTIYLGQTLRFVAPVRIGDTLRTTVTVKERDEARKLLTLACACINQDGVTVIEGEAKVLAPTEPILRRRTSLPEVSMKMGDADLQLLLEHARKPGPAPVAVVHPCDELSLAAVLDAHAAGLISPILVAPRSRLLALAESHKLDISAFPLEDVPHSHAAAARAIELVMHGKVEMLMKGSLHTEEFMGAVVACPGLHTKRRMSHCYLMQTPSYPRPFIITDAAVNIEPGLAEKADIIRNAIELAHVIGVKTPKVAILAAVETVNPRMPATLDAAALCKMADRGQITGAILDGPLAFDNAVSPVSARVKGIRSEVAGQADILVVPDLESGNLLAKQLEYMGGAISAGLVLGARIPLILTSRADSRETRLASCAVARMLAQHYRSAPP
ncbi:bifunctional enoyl-CoA hydratase/phosphate acetyltransferase [Herbaspirillum seropedicae]|uniref:Phosphate acetyl/butaryl transferase protein n=5 Tax=Herbaspirillum seropedicae TaxID=964 RepID=D8IVG7_HERSS|nr:bifunctional enoyl-CoA hydratase/phosphate acetyltransferase [Herbaspirillum seropedicae]ADJ63906.1 phosphate acetyl/butaryl transferase protein [Herbaspirillum seropedicae SmR1]AKN65891.1 bifunctional enoyl-CoA hydratase/phosphate acetyltransferase [Herbaspirillum seropedicae]NQE29041.1 bifunctional enoyl-CoA hydratase/phosphate acetyltransferase [Herbaspirillum seropedicae]UMU21868.1 bifunctional enoyl-CoA hydratase/phosphate acetyltransferase [Herbaspirillum seropedicae]